MPNVEPNRLDLTTARIRRANPSIDKETAREDAAIVHDIIARVRHAYTMQSTDWCGEESDTIETILRTVAGVSPEDHDAAASEGEWMMLQLTRTEQLTGEPDLYRKWLRVCGHVENFDYEDLFEDDEAMSDEDLLTQPEFSSDDDDDHRRRCPHPHLHLVTGPELTSDDDMTRRFLALMGGSS